MQTENKYQRGKIYKIISNQTNDVYYGSTLEIKLTNRLSKHRQNYRSWLNGKYAHVTSSEIVKYEDAKIILVENYPCNTKYELLAREQFYIDNNICVNKQKTIRASSNNEYYKQYYADNKEIIQERKNQNIKCDCGSSVRKDHKSKHLKTNKHIKYLETKIKALAA